MNPPESNDPLKSPENNDPFVDPLVPKNPFGPPGSFESLMPSRLEIANAVRGELDSCLADGKTAVELSGTVVNTQNLPPEGCSLDGVWDVEKRMNVEGHLRGPNITHLTMTWSGANPGDGTGTQAPLIHKIILSSLSPLPYVITRDGEIGNIADIKSLVMLLDGLVLARRLDQVELPANPTAAETKRGIFGWLFRKIHPCK